MGLGGLYSETWQAFAVLLPVRTVGVMGGERSYEFLGRAAKRIVNSVRGINWVVYDVTWKLQDKDLLGKNYKM